MSHSILILNKVETKNEMKVKNKIERKIKYSLVFVTLIYKLKPRSFYKFTSPSTSPS